MLDWGLDFLDGLANFAQDPAGTVAGWTFDKVTSGIFEWLARGLAVLVEWVWRVLDTSTTPRLTDRWFRNEVAGQLGFLAASVTVAMMLASAAQAALAGRPDQIGDTVKEAVRAIVLSAFTITVIDLMVRLVDEASAGVWLVGRDDLVTMLERMVEVTANTGILGQTFVGPLCLLFGFVGAAGIAVSLFMRSALIYVAAGLSPLVWSSSVLPVMRGASRRLVHLLVALVLAKLAIVVTLVIAVNLAGNAGGDAPGGRVDDAATAVGMLLTGFIAFLVAAISPMVLYRLMPTVEGAVATSGVVGGWGHSLMTLGHAAAMVTSGGSSAAAAAGMSVAAQGGVAGAEAGANGSRPAAGGPLGPSASQPAVSRVPSSSGGGGSVGEEGDDGNLPPLPPTPSGDGGGPQPGSGSAAAADDANLPPLPRTPAATARGASSPGSSAGSTTAPGIRRTTNQGRGIRRPGGDVSDEGSRPGEGRLR
jgi:hypothetical protein